MLESVLIEKVADYHDRVREQGRIMLFLTRMGFERKVGWVASYGDRHLWRESRGRLLAAVHVQWKLKVVKTRGSWFFLKE